MKNLPSKINLPNRICRDNDSFEQIEDTISAVNDIIIYLKEEKFPQSDEPKAVDEPVCGNCKKHHGETYCKLPYSEELPHWESDYAAIWNRFIARNYDESSLKDMRQDILELIRTLVK